MPRSRSERLAASASVSRRLTELDDNQLSEILGSKDRARSGIGGTSSSYEIAGLPVFVKRVPLTDLELLPDNRMSTANIHGLPDYYQYGLGSTGFGAWRELAAHTIADSWVTTGAHPGFPLLHHWRVLRSSPPGNSVFAEFGDLATAVAFWDDSTAVRRRLEALRDSTAELVLVIESIPWTLTGWLAEQDIDTYGRVQAQLEHTARFMSDHGLVHFDAHFDNILTDGETLFFADFGLALSSRFELARDEADFHARHRDYDVSYTTTQLVNRLAARVSKRADLGQFVRECAHGRPPTDIPTAVATLFDKHSPVAHRLNDFHRQLRDVSKRTPYPSEELALLNRSAVPHRGRPLRPDKDC